MSFLKIENVWKSFEGTRALTGIELEVDRWETIAIIGPSGCGKTTLLRCLALLDPIDEGAIFLAGEVVARARTGRRDLLATNINGYRQRVGMVFQQLSIWPNRTVIDNLTLAPRVVLGRSTSELGEEGFALLRQVGLTDKTSAYARALSGDQQQRLLTKSEYQNEYQTGWICYGLPKLI